MPPPEGPLRRIEPPLCGFHFYAARPHQQVMAIHYCAGMNAEMRQCVIYDSAQPDARLIGVEYIVSERLFRTLPAEEKRLWHSHQYEVKSGELFAPGMAPDAEKALMTGFANTYGKTWHFWQVDRGDALPLGIPQLMMGFTADGQIDPALLRKGEDLFGVSTEGIKRDRRDIATRPIAPGANGWMSGTTVQLNLQEL